MKIRITEKLKANLLAKGLIEANADDAAIKEAVADGLLGEKLSVAEIKDWQEDADGKSSSEIVDLLKQLVDQKNKAEGETKETETEGKNVDGSETKETEKTKTTVKAPAWATDGNGNLSKAVSEIGGFGSADQKDGFYIEVKSVKDMYSGTKETLHYPETMKSGADHPYAGQPIFEHTESGRRSVQGTSELEKAVNGAYVKLSAQANLKGQPIPRSLRMTEHDWSLIKYALQEMKWSGVVGGDCESVTGATGVKNRKLSQHEIKTIIDDVSTGGLEVAPISFDDQVITIPILSGELAPFVNMVPVARGRRIESATLGNMTLTSSGSVRDDQSIPLFATAGFISAFDTTIHVVNGAIEIGLDFLSDTPIDVAGHVTTKYGELLLNWLDEQIAIGDGVNEPEGIMVASGTTSVSFGGASPTIGGYESMMFGVPKKYKMGTDRSRIRFCSNETTYSRARGIPVGSTDARRLFGMNEEDYMFFNYNWAIVEAMANTQQFFANLARYRMYRRLGLTMGMTTAGRELQLRNKMLITARARYGGRLEDGSAATVCTNALA